MLAAAKGVYFNAVLLAVAIALTVNKKPELVFLLQAGIDANADVKGYQAVGNGCAIAGLVDGEGLIAAKALLGFAGGPFFEVDFGYIESLCAPTQKSLEIITNISIYIGFNLT